MVDTANLSLFVTDDSLQQYIVNKATGLPLGGGYVYFRPDNNRNTLKPVYQLSGSPPNYEMKVLDNPLRLSAAGTFVDENGNDIAVYYYPYDDNGNIENYFVQVFSSTDINSLTNPPTIVGTPQFTRENWPNINDGNNPSDEKGVSGFNNALSNSQFVDVYFDPSSSFSYTYPNTSATDTVQIAPDWFLEIKHTAGGTVTVTRNSISGATNSHVATNAPYTLTVQGGTNISELNLVQRLTNNNYIWSEDYVSTSIALGPSSGTVKVYYRPSNNVASKQLLFSQDNPNGFWQTFNNTVLLANVDNNVNSDTGYVDIVVNLPAGGSSSTSITSIQVIPVDENISNIAYDQEPVNRQLDHLFHDYKPQLSFKPIPSYLVGWDFPLNPAQFFGDTVAAQAVGANKSYYAWDQTILFQTANSGIAVSRDADTKGLKLTSSPVGGTQMALIQYLDATQARELLQNRMAVSIVGKCIMDKTYTGFVSLWATSDATLPNVASGTNNSIVATLNADGTIATRNGSGWMQINRSGLNKNPTFTLTENQTQFTFNRWDPTEQGLLSTATYFAIVISFPVISQNDYILFNSISLNAGDIATIPAPKTAGEVLRDCERYYEKSYGAGVAVGAGPNGPITENNSLYFAVNWTPTAYSAGAINTIIAAAAPFSFSFHTPKRVTNPTMSYFSPVSGTVAKFYGGAYSNADSGEIDITAASFWTFTTSDKGVNAYSAGASTFGGSVTGVSSTSHWTAYINFHYTADARLGVVL